MCRNTSPYLRLQGYDSSSQPFKLREDKSYNFNIYVYLPATAQTVHKEGAAIRLHIQLQVRLFFLYGIGFPDAMPCMKKYSPL